MGTGFLRDLSFHPQQHRKPESQAEESGSRDAGAPAGQRRGAPPPLQIPEPRGLPASAVLQLLSEELGGGTGARTPLLSFPVPGPSYFPNSPGLLRIGALQHSPPHLGEGAWNHLQPHLIHFFLASS